VLATPQGGFIFGNKYEIKTVKLGVRIMALNLENKKAIVEEISGVAAGSVSALTAEYRGMTVAKMNALRKMARERNIYVRVVRNTLTRIAIKDTEFACLDEALQGPLLLAFSKDAPGDAPRLFKDLMKTNEELVVKSIAVGGQLYGAAQLEAVANLPTKAEAISQLLGVLQAPLSQLLRVLTGPQEKLVRTLASVRDQKSA
jgi:large subunit ribosomal protein L10